MKSSTIETYGDSRDHIINGRRVASTGDGSMPVINPTTEEKLGSVPIGTDADVDAAVAAAKAAFVNPEWRDMSVADRARILRNLADEFEAHTEEMVAAITLENGSVRTISEWGNVVAPAGIYRYYADLIESTPMEEYRPAPFGADGHSIVRNEPIGVVGMITAWNAPQGIFAEKVGPVLATGCTAVIKPAPETPYDAYLFMELAKRAGVPDGVFNMVFGGAETGRALVRHPDVVKVSFTGSPVAGRDIAANAGEMIKPVTLELGGKSAGIFLDDADLEEFLPWVGGACIAHAGQICALSTRLLIPRSRYSEVTDAVADTMKAMRIGDPLDPATELGPVVADRQRKRIEGYIEIGREEGAKIATGGGRPASMERGFFLEPTLFTEVDNNMRIAREEIFGPVLVAIPYDTEEEAIAIANDSEYGLGGTVYTTDVERGTDVARRVHTGSIGVNMYSQFYNAPFGGVKNSGFGRELGPEGMNAYWSKKSIYRAGPAPK